MIHLPLHHFSQGMKENSSAGVTNILIKEIRKGNIQAFDSLYRQFSERLYGFAYSMLKDHEDSKEIVQETFLKLWAKRQQLDSSQSVKALLFSISYHITIDLLRKRLRQDQYQRYIRSHFSEEEPGNDNLAGYEELTTELRNTVQNLPEQRRKIYQLSREEGLSHKEIAEQLNISVKTVENQITLALKSIRQKLDAGNLLSLLFLTLFL